MKINLTNLFAKMTHFGHDVKGTEVVAAFPDAVRNGTCMFMHQEPSKDYSIRAPMTAVLALYHLTDLLY